MIEIRQVQEMEDFPADVQKAAAGFEEMQHESADAGVGAPDLRRRWQMVGWSPDGYRSPSRHRRGLADRIAAG